MAISKLFIAWLLFSLCVLHLVAANDQTEKELSSTPKGNTPTTIDCGSACLARCRLASRQRMCKRACGTCCQRCNCVPPGTSGNQEMCPCYASLTTHGGRRKCP